jgi:hypothetical protein
MPQRQPIVAASVAGLGLALAVVLGGCGGGAKFVARGSGPSAAVSPGSTAATPGGSASAGTKATTGADPTGTSKPSSTGKASTGSGSSGSSGSSSSPTKGTTRCTVSHLELFHALTDDGAMYQALGAPTGIGSPVCVPGYAMARTTASAQGGDRAEVLFQYTASTKTWKPVAGGTAVDCSAFVTTAEAKKLPGCVTG